MSRHLFSSISWTESGDSLNGLLSISVKLQSVLAFWSAFVRYSFFFTGDFCDARLSVKHTRTLQLDEDVLSVRYSPNQNLLAVSLLDCTVKIFYVDTLKVPWSCLPSFLTGLGGNRKEVALCPASVAQ